MRINVKVKPKAKKEYIKEVGEEKFEIAVSAPPEKGKANQAVIKALAAHFNVSRADVMIISGNASRNKVVEIHN